MNVFIRMYHQENQIWGQIGEKLGEVHSQLSQSSQLSNLSQISPAPHASQAGQTVAITNLGRG